MSSEPTTPGTSRRVFLGAAAATLASAGVIGGLTMPALARPRARKGLNILILGGTGFIGPAVVDEAQRRGHTLTLFNRGRTEKRLGTAREKTVRLYGNRDPKLRSDDADPTSPLGLEQLEQAIKDGARWDAVVDTSAFVPRIAKASADLLAPAADQYLFISTISVYTRNDQANADESAELGTMPDASVEEITDATYGPLKALCEQAVENAFKGRATQVRPGFIVGPGDPSDRFTYWPVRVSKGGRVFAPGAPSDAVQFIDVRDLADFILTCIEQKHFGVFNATGPEKTLTFGSLLEACKKAGGAEAASAEFAWGDLEFMGEQQVRIGLEIPIWVPSVGETQGFHYRNVSKAVGKGLKFRTPEDTAKAVLEWWPKEVERRERVGKQMVADLEKQGKAVPPTLRNPAAMRVGLSPEREKSLLAALDARKAAPGAPAEGAKTGS